ncbi:MAG: carboxylating nicotinate-nucleotide diphosphorylase [Thermoplasmata archaeon]
MSRARPVRGRRSPELVRSVAAALDEDRFRDDRTAKALGIGSIPVEGRVVAQRSGVLSGMSAAREVARRAGLSIVRARADGSPVRPGTEVLRLRGRARPMLGAERTLLNYLMHLSGVATATAKAVAAGRRAHPPLEVWGTRKTLPGLRDLEKAAIIDGGGRPHRRDLSDAILVKNNHLALIPLSRALARLPRARASAARLEVEVRSAREAIAVARAGVRGILIDNATPKRARAIVRALDRAGLRRQVFIELSGGITPQRVGRYRSAGADAASIGSLTHSAAALPFHLELVARAPPSS